MILINIILKSKIKEFSGIYPIMICPNDYSANKKTTSRSQDAPFWSFLKQNSRAIYRYTFQITSKIEKNKRKWEKLHFEWLFRKMFDFDWAREQ